MGFFAAAIKDETACAHFEVLWVVEVVGLDVPRLEPLTSVRFGAIFLVNDISLVLPPDGVGVWDGVDSRHPLL